MKVGSSLWNLLSDFKNWSSWSYFLGLMVRDITGSGTNIGVIEKLT